MYEIFSSESLVKECFKEGVLSEECSPIVLLPVLIYGYPWCFSVVGDSALGLAASAGSFSSLLQRPAAPLPEFLLAVAAAASGCFQVVPQQQMRMCPAAPVAPIAVAAVAVDTQWEMQQMRHRLLMMRRCLLYASPSPVATIYVGRPLLQSPGPFYDVGPGYSGCQSP